MTDVDDRCVFLAPAGNGSWYNWDPGCYHTSEECASRGTPWLEGARTKEWYLERAVKEGYRPCGICASGIEHEFVPADYPPGAREAYPGFGTEPIATDGGIDRSSYPWNVQIGLGGVTFEGPGMESRQEAEAIAEIVESSEPVDGVEVFRQ